MISIADVNPLCSLERNSLVFVQAARSGLTHEHVLQHIVSTARARASLPEMPSETPRTDSTVLLPGIARQVSCAGTQSSSREHCSILQQDRLHIIINCLHSWYSTEAWCMLQHNNAGCNARWQLSCALPKRWKTY